VPVATSEYIAATPRRRCPTQRRENFGDNAIMCI
jgi:hypothetical protein